DSADVADVCHAAHDPRQVDLGPDREPLVGPVLGRVLWAVAHLVESSWCTHCANILFLSNRSKRLGSRTPMRTPGVTMPASSRASLRGVEISPSTIGGSGMPSFTRPVISETMELGGSDQYGSTRGSYATAVNDVLSMPSYCTP